MATSTTPPIQATGRRKNAVASIEFIPGKGTVSVNGREFEDYFPTAVTRIQALAPLALVDASKKYDIKAKAHGGGIVGQAGALSLAISRALIQAEPETRGALKKKGLLMRDPRMKERKKSGQPGARKRFQFSKR